MLRPQSLSAAWKTSLFLLPTNLICSIGTPSKSGTCGQGTLASAREAKAGAGVLSAGLAGAAARWGWIGATVCGVCDLPGSLGVARDLAAGAVLRMIGWLYSLLRSSRWMK